MKITDVKLRFAKHYLFVQIYTDAGITGLGEAGNWGYLQATAAAIEKFADYLIGKDPFRIEDFNQNFLRSVYFRGSVIMSAISAIDIALEGCAVLNEMDKQKKNRGKRYWYPDMEKE